MRIRRQAFVACLLLVAAPAAAHEPDEDHAPDTAPVLVERVEAAYPAQARAAGVGGTVGLELTVDSDGRVAAVKVLRPAGFGFDEAAVAAAHKMRFRPALHDGKPVASTVLFDQRFVLRPHLSAESHADGESPPPPQPVYESVVQSRGPLSAASSSTIGNAEFELRPRSTPNDLLRVVPGLLAVQHQGGGKADQLFLRGFDADHGSDVAVYVDGVPINLPSHAHGQGFADLHFVIPEAIERIDVVKGPYDPRFGDFASAGAVNLVTRDRFAESSVGYTLGMYPTIPGRAAGAGRFVAVAAPSLPGWAAKLHPWVAFEAAYDQGPFEHAQHLQRYNLFAKVSYDFGPRTVAGVFLSTYGGGWNGSGQLPERAVAAGAVGRFGSLDPSEGGQSERHMVTAFVRHAGGGNEIDATAYVTRQTLSLWNDFTFFLRDPDRGDAIEQVDRRTFAGGKLAWHFHRRTGRVAWRTTVGVESRWDGAGVHAYHAGPDRERLDAYRTLALNQLDLAAFAEEDALVTRWLRLVAALRADYLGFDVDGDTRGVRQFSAFSPKASAIFSPIKDTLDLYLNFGIGFHTNPAEVALRDGQQAVDDAGNSFTLRAIPKLYGGEVGARAHLFDRLDLAAAFWLSWLENETRFSADAGGFVPAAATRRLGFDFQARARVLPWLWADLDLAQSTATAVPDAGNGGAVALAPRLYLTGGVSAQWRGLRGGLRLRYLAPRPAFDEASPEYQQYGRRTLSDGSPNPDYAPQRVEAEGWFVVDLYAAWRWRFLEAQLMVQNLFDSDWREAQFGNASCTRAEARDPSNPSYAVCGVTLAPAARVGVTDVHFTPGVPINLQLTLKAYF